MNSNEFGHTSLAYADMMLTRIMGHLFTPLMLLAPTDALGTRASGGRRCSVGVAADCGPSNRRSQPNMPESGRPGEDGGRSRSESIFLVEGMQ